MTDGDKNQNGESKDGKNDDHANPGGNQGESFTPITSEAELAQYKADLRKNIAADLRKSIADDLKAQQDTKAEDERKAREADEAKKRGEFETVETQLKTDLEAAKADAMRLTGENDRLKAAMASGVDVRWKEMPERVQKLYKGEAEDVLARWEYLHDDDVQALVKDLTDKTAVARGNGPDPQGNGVARPDDSAAKQANQRRYS